jgi:hypothetical protein
MISPESYEKTTISPFSHLFGNHTTQTKRFKQMYFERRRKEKEKKEQSICSDQDIQNVCTQQPKVSHQEKVPMKKHHVHQRHEIFAPTTSKREKEPIKSDKKEKEVIHVMHVRVCVRIYLREFLAFGLLSCIFNVFTNLYSSPHVPNNDILEGRAENKPSTPII